MTTYPIDYLKYVALEGGERLEYIDFKLSAMTIDHPGTGPEIEDLHQLLDNVRYLLADAVRACSPAPADQYTYSDGRQVMSRVDLEPGNYTTYVWHPDPFHPDNQAHTAMERVECTSGTTRSVIVAGAGVVDVATHVDDRQAGEA
jgi:hypothetical protein